MGAKVLGWVLRLCWWKIWGPGCGSNYCIAGSLGGSPGEIGWYISVSIQSALCINVFEISGLPGGIMMVSIMFEI